MVLNKLKKLKINKSLGPDAIHPRVIQEIAESINTPITLIFRVSLKLRELPDQWKHASVCAIFKKGTKTKPQNYRPVSLTSIICKTFESLIRDHIIETKQSVQRKTIWIYIRQIDNPAITPCTKYLDGNTRPGRGNWSNLLWLYESFRQGTP